MMKTVILLILLWMLIALSESSRLKHTSNYFLRNECYHGHSPNGFVDLIWPKRPHAFYNHHIQE
jgi:hypothetical protein